MAWIMDIRHKCIPVFLRLDQHLAYVGENSQGDIVLPQVS